MLDGCITGAHFSSRALRNTPVQAVNVALGPNHPFHHKDDHKGDHKDGHNYKDEKWIAPAPAKAVNVAITAPSLAEDKKDGSVDVGVNGRKLRQASADFPGGNVRVRATHTSFWADSVLLSSSRWRALPGSLQRCGREQVRGPAPGPAPAVAVNFPGGNVNVDPRTGVKVAFPGGNINVSGRKLKAAAGKHA